MSISVLWKEKENRKRVLILLLAFVLYFFIISKIFAYYSSEDVVTNRISAKSIGLELYEPEWDAKGSQLAARSEPGMTIPKDPYAKNTGNMDEVVRLKLEIRLDESRSVLPAGNDGSDMIHVASDTERKIAILRSILYGDDSSFMEIELGNASTIGNMITVKGPDGNTYTVKYKRTDFLIEEVSGSGSESFDFYFYYIGNNNIGGTTGYEGYDRKETVMETLEPGDATSALFKKLVYPIYKKDFMTIFDQGYDIHVYAEGILCKDFDERGLPHTIENFKKIAAEK